jgi:hypothetical protein
MLINEWLFAVGWRPVLMRETPDAAGSGGAAPAGGAAGGESGADAGPSAGDESAELASDAQAGAHAGDTGDDDDEFDALEPDQTARLEADPEGRRVLSTNK